MKAQNLLDMADREGSIQVDDYEIWIYTQSAIAKFLIIYHNRSYGILNRF